MKADAIEESERDCFGCFRRENCFKGQYENGKHEQVRLLHTKIMLSA